MRSVLEKEKLNGTNFLDWSRNLRIVLKQEKKLIAIDEAMPPEIKALNSYKMVSESSVSAHVLKMKGYIDTLDKLGASINRELATNLILASLPREYD